MTIEKKNNCIDMYTQETTRIVALALTMCLKAGNFFYIIGTCCTRGCEIECYFLCLVNKVG